ncbi:MAG: rhomboid family intramembrane serine protease [Bacteroidetes bacterium]|nr:rhomboid family intramembrane serine protease [Bacteroidota bacterium]
MFSLTTIIIGITVLISIIGFGQPSFYEKAMFRPFNILHNKEYWRWVSGGFVHADYFHLAVNMFVLYSFGQFLESYFIAYFQDFGKVILVVFYLLAIPVSSMYSYYKHKNDFGYAAIGASGAVAAMLFASILVQPFAELRLYFAIPIPAWLFGILYLVYEYYMGKKQQDNIGHDAHFYGAIYGLVFSIIIRPQIAVEFYNQVLAKIAMLAA